MEYESIIYSVLKKYDLLKRKDDYIDLCYIGYTKALNTYKQNKASFTTYLYTCIDNEIKKELERFKQQKRAMKEVSLDEILENENETKEFISSKYCLEDDYIKKESEGNIRKAISILSEREQEILVDTYINNLNKTELVKKYKIGICILNEILDKAYSKLKQTENYKILQ